MGKAISADAHEAHVTETAEQGHVRTYTFPNGHTATSRFDQSTKCWVIDGQSFTWPEMQAYLHEVKAREVQ